MLAPPGNFALDAMFGKLFGDDLHDLLDERLPLFLFHGHFGGQVIIELRIHVAERKILQFAFDPGDAKAIGHGRIDIQGLFGDAALLYFRLILQSPHIVETISQLHQDYPDVVRHGKEHLAKVLRLAFLLGFEVDLADLRNTIDQIRNLGAEDSLKFFEGCKGIFQGIVQKPGGNGLDIKPQIGEDRGHFHGMDQVRLSRKTHLSLVNLGGKDIGLPDNIQISSWVVGEDFFKNVIEPDHRS